MNLELTNDEAQALLNLCDMATRAQGLTAAQLALPMAVKIQTLINAEKESTPAAPAPAEQVAA